MLFDFMLTRALFSRQRWDYFICTARNR